jgi:hypothetical protein
MPGIQRYPQPRVQKQKAHEFVTTGSPDNPAFPARLVLTAYPALSLVIGFLATIPSAKRQLCH